MFMEFSKKCPTCDSVQTYGCRKTYLMSLKHKWECKKCATKKSAKLIDRSFQKTKEYREKMSKSIKNSEKYRNRFTEFFRKVLSGKAKKQWEEKRDKMMLVMTSDEYRSKHRDNTTKMWKDPDQRRKLWMSRNNEQSKSKWRNTALKTFNTDEYRKKQSRIQQDFLKTHPEKNDLNKHVIKKMWRDPSSVYHSTEFRKKLSESVKRSLHTPIIRKKHLEALRQSKWVKVKTDRGQLELIEKWNKLGFQFEPNYQVCTDVDLFYVDGYDPICNVVLEYDSKYHSRSKQKQKDLIRQNKIIDILKPKKFWRYDVVNKKFRDVLERNG